MKISEKRGFRLMSLAKKLGVEFSDLKLLNQALTHTSYANEHNMKKAHNERLEFLGDAVLELASSTYLFQHFPDMAEGDMTRARASLVCEDSLAEIAKKYNIGEYLLLSKGEDLNGGRKRNSILADAVESVIGALYLDRGWNIALQFVCDKLGPQFESIQQGFITRDFKSILQEYIQAQGKVLKYNLVKAEGPSHATTFTMSVAVDERELGRGCGNSKKNAEQKAAREALAALGVE